MKVRYKISKVFLSRINLNFLSMLTLVKAFFVIRSICFCQLPSFEISKPRWKKYKFYMYVIVDNPCESAIMLNNDMATIHAWSTR
jgi:hypothetical protein